MKPYLYYPGCSLTGTSKEYDLSVRALAEELSMELIEIEDWTCCGATAAQAVDTGLALALGARNLALAGRTAARGICKAAPSKGRGSHAIFDVLVPCSACYLNLKTCGRQLEENNEMNAMVTQVLAEEGLALEGKVRVRHLLDVLSRDVDWKGATNGSTLPAAEMPVSLEGLVVAPYYGCQCLRPFRVFDDPEEPHSMEAMIRATGARVLSWDMGAECCGASHGTTKPAVGRMLTQRILAAARGAHCIVTVCPMCQMNLEMFQDRAHPVPVLYLPQLLGVALGVPGADLGLALNLTDSRELFGG